MVFLNDQALANSSPQKVETFATTAHTKTHNTATVDPKVLETSNGHKGFGGQFGSTSKGKEVSASGAMASRLVPGLMALGGVVFGAVLLGRAR